jgi:hypothetical protein
MKKENLEKLISINKIFAVLIISTIICAGIAF